MRLTINGLERELDEPVSLTQLIEAEGDPPEAVLVEVNGVLVTASHYDTHPLADGDRVEIILPAFGG